MMVSFAMSTISFDIPRELGESLAKFSADISRTAKQALLVDLYRRRAITLRTLREVLGLARIEVDEVLARHVVSHELSVDEFDEQSAAFR